MIRGNPISITSLNECSQTNNKVNNEQVFTVIAMIYLLFLGVSCYFLAIDNLRKNPHAKGK
jgi:hypothetical protein